MQEDIKEKELIARAKNGDNPAFEELILKYKKKIYSLCYRMTGEHCAGDIRKSLFQSWKFPLGRAFLSMAQEDCSESYAELY